MKQLSQISSIGEKASKPAILLVLIILISNGCHVLGPKTAAVKQIHTTYRNEFQSTIQLSIGDPKFPVGAPKANKDQFIFTNTLRSIRDFQTKYPNSPELNAHLNVLQGMIYLQSGEIGMANLVKDNIKSISASSTLKSKNGGFTRDQLFAESFEHLSGGWSEIKNQKDSEDSPGRPGADEKKLEKAADQILNLLSSPKYRNINSSDIDEGVLYLAITASIFYTWEIALDLNLSDTERCERYKKGKLILEQRLSPQEIDASKADVITEMGRYRYISWYKFLARKVQGCLGR